MMDILKNISKNIFILPVLLVMLTLIIGVSFAYYKVSLEGRKEISLNIEGGLSLTYSWNNEDYTLDTSDVLSDEDGKDLNTYYEFSVSSTATTPKNINYLIYIEELESTISNSDVNMYLTSGNDSVLYVDTTNVGELTSYEDNSYKLFVNGFELSASSTLEHSYRLRSWIEEGSSMSSTDIYKYQIKVIITSDEKTELPSVDNPTDHNIPDLKENMIAVYYDESNSVWRKADSANVNNNWYDYDNKKWANAVTVKETGSATSLTLVNNSTQACSGNCTRIDYKNAAVGTVIPMDDINTMMVWIPRYSYEVFNYNASGATYSNPQEINIEFETGLNESTEILCVDNIQGSSGDGTSEVCRTNGVVCRDDTCNGKMYTHPAFCFGDKNSDGICPEENRLEGLWVSKFELSGTISAITAKPGLSSLVNQTVSSFSTAIMAMNDSANIYGFSTSDDIHMMKNMEWGAVAYLSHSRYGTCSEGSCKEVKNNAYYVSSTYMTGCGPTSANSTSTTTICNAYDTDLGLLASTTQNIYGIYDMAGGANDYVMGNLAYLSTKMLSGYSGFAGVNESGVAQTGTSYPASKYYDKYSYGTSSSDAKSLQRTKLGDSIKEVGAKLGYNWYEDYGDVADSSWPWFGRGGRAGFGSSAGVFNSYGSDGDSSNNYSSHFVLTR